MHTTFTIQSVHGLKQTVVLIPGGTVGAPQSDEQQNQRAESNRDRSDGAGDQKRS